MQFTEKFGDKMKNFISAFIFVFFLSACATQYKRASSPTSEGYYDNILQEGVYDVSFNANSDTNIKIVKDYVLLRAAEVCLENNYKTFYIVSKDDNSRTESGAIANTMYGRNSAYTFFIPVSETSPSASIIVKCSKENDLFFKAEDVKNNLRKKYNLQEIGEENKKM